jgi:hypothetical protein
LGAAEALVRDKFTEAERIPCSNHGLNLTAAAFLDKLPTVVSLMTSLKAWIEGDETESKKERLRDEGVPLQPLRFSSNRWGSTVEAIITLSRHWRGVRNAVTQYQQSCRKHRYNAGLQQLERASNESLIKGTSCILSLIPKATKLAQAVDGHPKHLNNALKAIRLTLWQYAGYGEETTLTLLSQEVEEFTNTPAFTSIADELCKASDAAYKKFDQYVSPAINVLNRKEVCMRPLQSGDRAYLPRDCGITRASWNWMLQSDDLIPNSDNVKDAIDHWKGLVDWGDEVEKLALAMLRFLITGASNATVERNFSQCRNRIDDSQAANRNKDLTEGLVKSVGNSDLIFDMTRTYYRSYAFVRPDEDTE